VRLRKIINLAFLILMGGCVGLSSAFAAAAPITLSILCSYTSENQKASIKQILEQYERLHPNIKLKVQITTTPKWPDAMRLRAIANDYPDVTVCPLLRVGQWAAAGKLAAGNQYIPASVLNKYSKARLASVTYYGKIYGLPFSDSVRAVLYNVDFFAKAGITPPQKAEDAWTWEQLVAAAQKAQAASGAKYALQFERPSFDGWLPFIYQAGGQMMDDNCVKPNFNTPQVRKALEWTVKLHREGIAAPGVMEGIEDPRRLFAFGLTTMWLGAGNWMIEALEPQMKYKYSYTFMPRDARAATVATGQDWIAFKGAHQKEAWDLLLYLVSPGPMTAWCEVSNSIPARSDVHAIWRLHPELAPFFAAQARECPETLMNQQIHPAYGACRDKMMQELSTCICGQKSVPETLAALDRILGDAMKLFHY
jgi:multiple sugar transport system substrate-binding protein